MKSNRATYLLGLGILTLLAAGLFLLAKRTSPAPRPTTAVGTVEVSRRQLELRSARLHQLGQTNPFSGLMLERYSNGRLRSRSAVTNGLLCGLSEGWHTNGQLQVTEHFKAGVSHGRRTKYYANGLRQSEVDIVDGKLQGVFRRWHTNGVLAEKVELADNQPDGLSLAYFPGGSLKTRALLQGGKVVAQTSWREGEKADSDENGGVQVAPGPGSME